MVRSGFKSSKQLTKKQGTWDDFSCPTERACETFLKSSVLQEYPEDSIIGEEHGEHEGIGTRKWYIDPIDGTGNFVQGIPFFAISLSIYDNGKPVASVVFDPIHDECFSADRSGLYLNNKRLRILMGSGNKKPIIATEVPPNTTRQPEIDRMIKALQKLYYQSRYIKSLGSTSLELAYVAAGRLHAFVLSGLFSPWDVAAGAHLVMRAGGGEVTTWSGKIWSPESDSIIAAPKITHIYLHEFIKDI